MVRLSYELTLRPDETTVAVLDEAASEDMGEPAHVSVDALSKALDASMCPLQRTLFGGPSLSAVEDQLKLLTSNLGGDESNRQ